MIDSASGTHTQSLPLALHECREALNSAPPASRRYIGKRKSGISIHGLCANMIAYILSYLDHYDIERFGATSKAHRVISRQSNLWTAITISKNTDIDVKTLRSLVIRTSPALPLLQLHIHGSCGVLRPDCCSSESSMAKTDICCTDLDVAHPCNRHCQPCVDITNVASYFSSLRSLTLSCVSWGTTCSLQTVISSTSTLVSLSISHDVDVNEVMAAVAGHCPLLEELSFSYVNVLQFDREVETPAPEGSDFDNLESSRFDHPPLLPQVGRDLADRCPLIKKIRFSHYTIDEEGVQQILHLSEIENVDFSDNESLHGIFLVDIPTRWPKLKSLTMRDCTELEDEHVTAFANLLTLGGCPELMYVDLSCQWAFFDTSLLNHSLKDELVRTRNTFFTAQHRIITSPSCVRFLCWREDQCEIEGFGIDPEDGIGSIDDALSQDQELKEPLLESGEDDDDDCGPMRKTSREDWEAHSGVEVIADGETEVERDENVYKPPCTAVM